MKIIVEHYEWECMAGEAEKVMKKIEVATDFRYDVIEKILGDDE
jgi:hypothetical protein